MSTATQKTTPALLPQLRIRHKELLELGRNHFTLRNHRALSWLERPDYLYNSCPSCWTTPQHFEDCPFYPLIDPKILQKS